MAVSGSTTSPVGYLAGGAAVERLQVVVVLAGGRRCAFLLRDVEEVQRVVRITPLPGLPEGIEGVVDRRGEIVAVLDGRRRLGEPSRPVQLSDRLVFVRTPERVVALRVDAAVAVVDVPPPSALPPEVGARATTVPAIGVARVEGDLLVVVDIERFLTAEDVSLLDAVLAEREHVAP